MCIRDSNAFADTGDAVGTQTGALGRPQVMRHSLGSRDDELVADLPDLDRVIFDWGVSHDGHWLWLLPRQGTENRNMLWVHPLVTRDGRTEIGERVQLVGEPDAEYTVCLLYTSPSPRDRTRSRMPSSA